MNEKTVEQHILQHAVRDGDRLKLTCKRGHQLAAELGVAVARIGEICQVERIKITHCQLGCFGGHRD